MTKKMTNMMSPLRRMSAMKIALLSLLPLLNQILPSLWLMTTTATTSDLTASTASTSYHPFIFLGMPKFSPPSMSSFYFDKTRFLQHQLKSSLWLPNKKPRIVYLDSGKHFSLVFRASTRHPTYDALAINNQTMLDLHERSIPYYPMPREHPCDSANVTRKQCRVASGPTLHKANFPSCNSFHEMDLQAYLTPSSGERPTAKLVGQGGKRLVWKIIDWSGEFIPLVALKMFKYRKERHHDFGPLALEYQRRDAVMHQAGSASPYIVDIYGFCGASAMNEFGDGGDLQSNIDQKGPILDQDKLLSTAYEIAAGLRDFHTIGTKRKHHPPALAHADIYGNQWVRVKGQYKLTDFNLAKFLLRNKTSASHENFPFRRDVIDNWFAPEVHRQGELAENIVTDKMDIWGLGNVLYLILTGTKPFQGIPRSIVHQSIMNRTVLRPPIPTILQNSTRFAHRAVIEAIDECHKENPNERPTARQVAQHFKKALLQLRNYNNLQEFELRAQRFPSVEERIKRYMSSWYTVPCNSGPDDDDDDDDDDDSQQAHILYQPLLPTLEDNLNDSSNDNSTSTNHTFVTTTTTQAMLFQGLGETDHIVKIVAKLQTDDAMILQPAMLLESSNKKGGGNHAGYRTDIMETVMPFWTALQDKPLLTQWGDKTSLVLSDLTRLDESHPPLNLPHLKKCRRVLTQQQLDDMIPPDGSSCRDSTSSSASQQQSTGNKMMQPIIWKLDSHRLLGTVADVPKHDVPWSQKRNQGVFRGRLTGNALREDRSVVYRDEVNEVEYCDLLPRCRLVRQHGDSRLVDAKVIEMRHKPLNTTIGDVSLIGNKMMMQDFLQYKVLIVLEGNDVPSGLGWSLRSNSVVLMPPPTWSSWLMEELLQPWVHYIPLEDPNLADVEEKIQWVLDNEAEAQKISHRATLWMMDLLEHPDAQRDNDEIFKQMLHRYQQHFLYSDELLEQYETQVEAPTRPPKAKPRKTFVITH